MSFAHAALATTTAHSPLAVRPVAAGLVLVSFLLRPGRDGQ
jgi:hypothetical protein